MVSQIERNRQREGLRPLNADKSPPQPEYDIGALALGLVIAGTISLIPVLTDFFSHLNPPNETTTTSFITPTDLNPRHNPEHGVIDKIGGLTEKESQITGIVDPDTLSATYYWTFVINNVSGRDQEAQMRLALPDHATVSRATLWVNGQPQEAAFSDTWKVENAYNWITQRHRDPLLVKQIEPGKILIKAAPVLNNDKMMFRIGITAGGRVEGANSKFDLPRVEASNFTTTKENIHLQSTRYLNASNVGIETVVSDGRYLAKGQLQPEDSLSIKLPRPRTEVSFATRATHSATPGFIVASLEQIGPDMKQVKLAKVSDRPSCPIVGSEEAAYRLSSLWAYDEIEKLHNEGQDAQAGELANAYRIVSSVSGATVLERESDYQYNGLNRDQYKALNYSSPAPDAFSSFSGGQFNTLSQTRNNDAPMMMAPALQGATNGTIGPQGADATVISGVNTAGTVRVNNLANAEALANIVASPGGPIATGTVNWLTASARDANLFDGMDVPGSSIFSDVWLGIPALALTAVFLIGLTALNYVGPAATLSCALRTRSHKLLFLGIAWLAAALVVPIGSQIAAVIVLFKRSRQKRKVVAPAAAI